MTNVDAQDKVRGQSINQNILQLRGAAKALVQWFN